MSDYKIGFIGAGNMASALVGGLISEGFAPDTITLSDINEEQLHNAQKKYGVAITTSNETLVSRCNVILIAVKPQVIANVLEPLSDLFGEHKPLVISIVAGITLDSLASWLGKQTPIVRCMPNTPALELKGAAGLYPNSIVSQDQKDLTSTILNAVGISTWLTNEDEIDSVTALSGSGPAYFFLVIESMIAAGIKLGLSEHVSRDLTLQTALGAAVMAGNSELSVSELRQQVTSPGGTTEAALNTFNSNELPMIFEKAMAAAFEKSKELAAGN